MPAEVDHVLPLGPRVASKVDLANRTGLEEERRTGRGGRRRPRDASTGREGTKDWLNGGEEGGGGEGGESKGVLELKKAEGESRELETRGKETVEDVAE